MNTLDIQNHFYPTNESNHTRNHLCVTTAIRQKRLNKSVQITQGTRIVHRALKYFFLNFPLIEHIRLFNDSEV